MTRTMRTFLAKAGCASIVFFIVVLIVQTCVEASLYP